MNKRFALIVFLACIFGLLTTSCSTTVTTTIYPNPYNATTPSPITTTTTITFSQVVTTSITITQQPKTITETVVILPSTQNGDSGAQALLNFTNEGLDLWQSALEIHSDAIDIYLGELQGDSITVWGLHTQVEQLLQQLQSCYAPTNALAVKNALFEQLNMLKGYIEDEYYGYYEQEHGNQTTANTYFSKFMTEPSTDGYWDFRDQNKMNLLNLQMQAQDELS